MEIARQATGHRPDFLHRTAGTAIRGACTAGEAIIRYAYGSTASVVLYLLTQSAVGGLPGL